MKKSTPIKNYSKITITLHWLTLLLMIAVFALVWSTPEAETVEALSPDELKLTQLLMGLHISVGISIFAVIILRLVLRFIVSNPPAPKDLPHWQSVLSKLVQFSLITLVVVQILMGILFVNGNGWSVSFMNWFELPKLIEKNEELAKIFQVIHKNLWMAILALVGIHSLAALYHHYIRKDQILLRMLGKAK